MPCPYESNMSDTHQGGIERRVVLDTNVFIAARWNPRSASAALLRLCEEGKLQACYTSGIRAEVNLILRSVRAPQQFKESVERVFAGGKFVARAPRVNAVKDDPDDNKYLACALAATAALVTSDRHLLQMNGWRGVRVMSPGAFERTSKA
jgi:putative PIN family toxin of toxin-antitoxin system